MAITGLGTPQNRTSPRTRPGLNGLPPSPGLGAIIRSQRALGGDTNDGTHTISRQRPHYAAGQTRGVLFNCQDRQGFAYLSNVVRRITILEIRDVQDVAALVRWHVLRKSVRITYQIFD